MTYSPETINGMKKDILTMLEDMSVPTPDIETIKFFIQQEQDQDTVLGLYTNLCQTQNGQFQNPTLQQFIADTCTPALIQRLGTEQLYRRFTDERLDEVYVTFPKRPPDLEYLARALYRFLFGRDGLNIPPSSFASVHDFYTQITAETEVTLEKLYEICASVKATDPTTREDTLPLLSPEMLEAYGMNGEYAYDIRTLAKSIRERLPPEIVNNTQWGAFVDNLPSLHMDTLMDLYKTLHAMNADIPEIETDNKEHKAKKLVAVAASVALCCLGVSNFVLSHQARPWVSVNCAATHSVEVRPLELRIDPKSFTGDGTVPLLPADQEEYNAIKQDQNSEIALQKLHLEAQTAEFNVYTLRPFGIYRTTEILGHPITTKPESSLASCTAKLPNPILIGEKQIGQTDPRFRDILKVPHRLSSAIPGEVYRLQGHETPTNVKRLQLYDGEHTDHRGRPHQHFGTFLEQRNPSSLPVFIAVLALAVGIPAYRNKWTRNALESQERQNTQFRTQFHETVMLAAGLLPEKQTTLQEFLAEAPLAWQIEELDKDRS